jgi:MtN3 and saliva related transmembrane protein
VWRCGLKNTVKFWGKSLEGGIIMLVIWLKYFVEIMFGLGLFFNAALFIPQAVKMFRTKSSEGVSLLTFAGFNVMQFFTLLHGYLNKDYLLLFGFFLSFIFCGVVTFLIMLYRK